MNFRYTKHVATILIFVFMAILYTDVLAKLVGDWWKDPNYSHGFLIPFISVYLIWERRKFLRATQTALSTWGLPVLFASGILYIVGHITGELFTQRFSFVTMLAGLALTWRGKAQWRVLWAPVLYLVFMIPLPYIVYDSIAFPLKLLATEVSITTLQYLNQSIYSEGNLIFLPDTTLEVADACSGIRSLISILALSIIIAKYTQHDWPRRFLLVALSIPVVIFMNILRIVGTGLLAAKDPDLSTGFFHVFSGEAIFLAGIIFLLGIAMLMAKRGRRKVHTEVSESSVEPIHNIDNSTGTGKWWPKWAALVILLLTVLVNFSATQVRATPLIRSLKRSDGALIRISGPADDVQNARKIQHGFIHALYPVLAEFLPS